MSEGVYQHFRPEEREFIDRATDWLQQVEDRYTPVNTYFLNPRELYILTTLSQARQLRVDHLPAQGEYTRALVAPSDYAPQATDFGLSLLQIDYNGKFGQISHAQILGTLLGETGIDRRELGDILLSADGGQAQIFVSSGLTEHFIATIKKIAGLAVTLSEVPLSAQMPIRTDETAVTILVSSLRLDKIIAASLSISRNIAGNMIQSSKIKVNYMPTVRKDLQLTEGDLISVRGYGRLKLLRSLGQTKKGKIKLEISKISSHK